MTSNPNKTKKWTKLAFVAILALAGIAVPTVESSEFAPSGDTATQITFQSPDQAATALDEAAKTGDQNALIRVLGREAKALVTTGDAESDKLAMEVFNSKYERMHRWLDMTDGRRVLYIGADNFAFPVPLAKNSSGQWYFDGAAGAEEIRARDIGRNELLAIDGCFAIANAQQIYFQSAHDGDSMHEYAQRIISTAGRQDGLFWPVSGNEPLSPLGSLDDFAKQAISSANPSTPLIIDGYTFRILTGQGDMAPGGTMSYLVHGRLTNGFATIASPVKYGDSGVMTFLLSREGVVYQQDLGEKTGDIAASIRDYNPGEGWTPVE